MKIGNVNFDNIAFLAPMAGVADRAFREVCTDFGASYSVTEMISAKGLTMGDKKSRELMIIGSERPTGIQLFGDDSDVLAKAAIECLDYKPDIIDINMGCPAPKIAMNGSGCALMKNPNLCAKIIKSVTSSVKTPVTVKIRKGWDDEHLTALQIAHLAEENGAAAVAIHARTRTQMYSGQADLEIIRQIKSELSIPVIGNGDIVDVQSAAIMLDKTNCDAIMIGRGAMGNPWIFRNINAYLNECRVLPSPPVSEKMRVMLSHIKRAIDYKGEYVALREARHHAAYYTKGIRGSAALRREISTVETYEQLCEIAFKISKENS